MLTELSIRNLAVIESVHLQFRQGFHVLTGETGAGKSIIIDALSLVIGARGSADLVRHGCERAEVEASFDIAADHPVWDALKRFGFEASYDEPLVIRREVTIQGKSAARINGRLANLSMLREIGEWLVNIHGQHEHQSLLKTDQHLKWLDLYGEAEIGPAKQRYRECYETYTALRKELRQLSETSQQALQMQDLYRFQQEEIAAAGLKIGEDECLAEEKRKLANAEKLYHHAAQSYELLYAGGKGLDAIGKALKHVQDIAPLDPNALNPILSQMQDAYYQLEDAAYQLREYRDAIEFRPDRLEEIERRLDAISLLKRKYGEQISDILAYLQNITEQLAAIENKDEKIAELKKRLDEETKRLVACASDLTDIRKTVALRLAGQIEEELRELHMEKTRFEVQMTRTEDDDDQTVGWKVNRDGWDEAEFMISPNPGEPLRPLSKIASGGEISRIMLAMKAIFARVDRIPVLVFDEVDTGVSGRAAQAIAEKMASLSRNCQVFAVTHLPQVACMADAHYSIEKAVEGGRTFTRVRELDDSARASELARMLGGVEVTGTTLSHAQEMLAMANAKKARM
jgi:DNA repair protein RecN (Recombination protein N)